MDIDFAFAVRGFLTALVLVLTTGCLAGKLGDWARRRGLLDRPTARSSHLHPTPRLGGVAILLMVSGPALAWAGASGGGRLSSTWPTLCLLGLAVGLISLLDDLRGLPALFRLGTHVAVAFGVLTTAGTLGSLWLPGGRELDLGSADWPLSMLWIVGCINAFNFMDGIDGLAGGQAVVLGLAWLVIGAQLPSQELQVLGLLVACSTAGFLLHNWSPARVFMGDAGSAFLGYWAAVAPFCSPRPGRLLVPAVLTVWPFLFDTTLTLLGRARRGEPLLVAHRGHLYQRLVTSGASHARVALAYIGLAACGAVAASLAALDRHPGALWAAALLPPAALALVVVVVRRERVSG